jgi:hypothetical protein
MSVRGMAYVGAVAVWPPVAAGFELWLQAASRRLGSELDRLRSSVRRAGRAVHTDTSRPPDPNTRSACPSGVLRLSITGKSTVDKSARKPSAEVDDSARAGRPNTGQHTPVHTGSVGVRGSRPLSSHTLSSTEFKQVRGTKPVGAESASILATRAVALRGTPSIRPCR